MWESSCVNLGSYTQIWYFFAQISRIKTYEHRVTLMISRSVNFQALITVSIGLLLLLPLWSNPGVFWDGWVYDSMIRRDMFEGVLEPFERNGRNYSAYIIWLFSVFPNPSFASLIASVVCIAGAGALFYVLLRKNDLLPPFFAAIAVLLGIVFPAYEVSLSLSSVNFQLALFSFYLGFYFAIKAADADQSGYLGYSFLSAVFIFLSFTGEATIFLTPFIMAFWGLVKLRKGEAFTKVVLDTLQRLGWLLGLSLIGAYLLLVVFVPTGEYADDRFNEFTFSKLSGLFGNYVDFVWDLAAAPLALLFIYYLVRHVRKNPLGILSFKKLAVMWLGCFGFLVAITPYIIGAREATTAGWSVRFLMYAGFPVGLICMGLLWAFVQQFKIKSVAYFVLPVLFLISHVKVIWEHSVEWQTRWVRDQHLMTFVNSNIPADAGLILINEQSPTEYGNYRWYEQILMIQSALGRSDVVANRAVTAESLGVDVQNHYEAIKATDWGKPLVADSVRNACYQINFNSDALYEAPLKTRLLSILKYNQGFPVAAENMINFDVAACGQENG